MAFLTSKILLPLLLLLAGADLAMAEGGGAPAEGPGVVDLILKTGPVAKTVLLLLFLSSIICWTIIVKKLMRLKAATEQNAQFMDAFSGCRTLEEVISLGNQFPAAPVAVVFQAGAQEMTHMQEADAEHMQGNVTRAMARASNHEIAELEQNTGFLATTASAAPFIGLFGTVWGIMNSFSAIGAAGTANLAVVMPGIAEALITTAIGIGSAVPAVVGYNHIVAQVKRLSVDMDVFTNDFQNMIQRHLSGAEVAAEDGEGEAEEA